MACVYCFDKGGVSYLGEYPRDAGGCKGYSPICNNCHRKSQFYGFHHMNCTLEKRLGLRAVGKPRKDTFNFTNLIKHANIHATISSLLMPPAPGLDYIAMTFDC